MSEGGNQYVIHATGEQLRVIQEACEEYLRLRMGQASDLAQSLAFDGFTYNKDRPGNEEDFCRRIHRRDDNEKLLRSVLTALKPDPRITKDAEIASDVWQVIRHFRWMQRDDTDRNDWCVDAGDPWIRSGEPPIIVTEDEDENVGAAFVDLMTSGFSFSVKNEDFTSDKFNKLALVELTSEVEPEIYRSYFSCTDMSLAANKNAELTELIRRLMSKYKTDGFDLESMPLF